MRIVLRPIAALGRFLRLLVRQSVRLTLFSVLGAVLLFVLDLVLVRDHRPPDR